MKVLIAVLIVVSALAALGGWTETRQMARDAARFPAAGQFVQVDGRSLHVLCGGPKTDPLVLFEAGAGGSSIDWRQVAAALSAEVRTCAYDRAGLGWSDTGPAPRDFQALLRDLQHVLDAVGGDTKIVIVGHSLGGLIAQSYARQRPDRVAGLVLVDSLEVDFFDQYAAATQSQVGLLRVASKASYLGIPRLLGLGAAPKSAPADIQDAMLARGYRRNVIDAIADEAAAMSDSVAYLRSLPPIEPNMPIVVVSRRSESANAAMDADWSDAQLRLASLNQNTTHIISDSGDHYLQFSDVSGVTSAIKSVQDQLSQE